jgi:hypothetical protein
VMASWVGSKGLSLIPLCQLRGHCASPPVRNTGYRVNPPLPRLLATLPLLVARPSTDVPLREPGPGERPEWEMGPAFAAANGSRYFDLVCLARLAGIGWSLLGGLLVCAWARELYGGTAGCVGLALWCMGPNVLAHAALVTPDVPAAVAGLAATYAYWRSVRRPSWGGAWLAGLLLGLAELTKHTMLILHVVWPLLGWLYGWRVGRKATPSPPTPLPPRGEGRKRLGQTVLILGLSLLVLNAGYGFAGAGRPLGQFRFVSRLLGGEPPQGYASFGGGLWGNRFRGSWLGALPLPLPADYLLGIDVQRRDFEARWPSYLGGEWQAGGRWYFYLYALAVKVPLGTLALVLAGLLLALFRHPAAAAWRDELAVWLPAVVLLVFVSSQTGLNYLRYLLPAFPFAAVGAAKLGHFLRPGRWHIGMAVLGLLGWSASSSLAVQPHPLAYFNEAAGGPEHGDAHLIDSNLDWGQDLLDLKDWLNEHPEARPLGLVYCNRVDPRGIGIDFHLPPIPEGGRVAPGWYAVSVNFLRGMPFTAPDGQGGFRRVPAHAYDPLAGRLPVARAGHTLFVFFVASEEKPLVPGEGQSGASVRTQVRQAVLQPSSACRLAPGRSSLPAATAGIRPRTLPIRAGAVFLDGRRSPRENDWEEGAQTSFPPVILPGGAALHRLPGLLPPQVPEKTAWTGESSDAQNSKALVPLGLVCGGVVLPGSAGGGGRCARAGGSTAGRRVCRRRSAAAGEILPGLP